MGFLSYKRVVNNLKRNVMKLLYALLYHILHTFIAVFICVRYYVYYARNCLYFIWTWAKISGGALLNGVNVGDYRTNLERIKLESFNKTLRKVPKHVAIVIVEDSISYKDLAKLVFWNFNIGIPYVTLYDGEGKIQKNFSVLEKYLLKEEILLQKQYNVKFSNSLCNGSSKNGYSTGYHLNIFGGNDGREDLVMAARSLSNKVKDKVITCRDISVELISSELHTRHLPEPELLLRFGFINSVVGFQPWLIRVTEMLSLPTHHFVRLSDYLNVVTQYSRCQQRLGK